MERRMRELTGHCVNPANDKLRITVTDQLGAGGANHRYSITGFDATHNPSRISGGIDPVLGMSVLFQNGPIGEYGVNGVTQEVLLEIVADRLRSFQAGSFANEYNAKALKHVLEAQEALLSRTRDRMTRGVEGKSEK